MRLLRHADRRRFPWKNGGGEMADVASAPDGAGWDDLQWRVGMAWIDRSGPFSDYPLIDRTLMVLDGPGIVLDVQGMPSARLTTDVPPHVFPGDAPTDCRLIATPTVVLNAMTRRSAWRHRMRRERMAGATSVAADGPLLLFLIQGAMSVDDTPLDRFDAVLLESGEAARLKARSAIVARVALSEGTPGAEP